MDKKSLELEMLKMDLENVIQGMTICAGVLSKDEQEYLALFNRCLSLINRIKPIKEDKELQNET